MTNRRKSAVMVNPNPTVVATKRRYAIPNSHFCYPRDTPLEEICPGYTEWQRPPAFLWRMA